MEDGIYGNYRSFIGPCLGIYWIHNGANRLASTVLADSWPRFTGCGWQLLRFWIRQCVCRHSYGFSELELPEPSSSAISIGASSHMEVLFDEAKQHFSNVVGVIEKSHPFFFHEVINLLLVYGAQDSSINLLSFESHG